MKKTLLILALFFIGFTYAQEGVISKITIEGNKRTRTSFLKRLAFVKEGSKLDTVRIASDIRRLKLLASVANAEHKLVEISPGQYQLTYIIDENFAIIPGVNVFTANNGEVAYRFAVFDFNFLGRNQILGGFFRRDVFNSYGGYWEAPNLFTRKLGIGLNYKNLVSLEPVFFPGNTVDYKFDSKAFEIKLQYEPNFHNQLESGFNIAREDYSFEAGNLPTGTPSQLGANLFSVIGSYEYNNIDIYYQYVSGFRSEFNYRIVTGANGETDLLRNAFIGRNDFEYFKRVGTRGNWANRFRVAYATNDTSPFAPSLSTMN